MHSVSVRKILLLFICCSFATTLCVKAKGSTSVDGSYLIRARLIEDVPEALAILRRFIARGPNELRCERYAVLLNSLTSSQVDQFSVADLGLAPVNTVRRQFRLIDVETLRQLYIDAINKFRGKHFDQSLLELMDCLSQKFRTIDAKARSFLNNKMLQELIRQYKSIMDEPLDFLLDSNYKHPTLTRDQVDPEIKQTLLDLFNDNSTEVELRFKPSLQVPYQSPPATVTLRPTVQRVAPHVQASSGVAASSGDQVVATRGGDQVIATSGGDQVDATSGRDQVVATSNGDQVAVTSDGDQVVAADRPSTMQRNLAEIDLEGPVKEMDLSNDEQEYLADFIISINKLYSTLPLTTKLNDRCEAYAKLIQADQSSLKGNIVEDIVHDLEENLSYAAVGPAEKVYSPDSSVRENFLFSLKALGREKLGDEIWIDFVDCVSQWEQDDPEVERFMKSEELAKAYEEMLKTIEPVGGANDEQLASKNTSE